MHHHSGSRTASLTLFRDPGSVTLEIMDQGRGIRGRPRRRDGPSPSSGSGIAGMRERVRQLGGELDDPGGRGRHRGAGRCCRCRRPTALAARTGPGCPRRRRLAVESSWPTTTWSSGRACGRSCSRRGLTVVGRGLRRPGGRRALRVDAPGRRDPRRRHAPPERHRRREGDRPTGARPRAWSCSRCTPRSPTSSPACGRVSPATFSRRAPRPTSSRRSRRCRGARST